MQLKNNALLYFIPLFLFSYGSAANQITPADRNILQQQQREMLEQNRQQREALERSITPSVTTPSQPAVPGGICFPINDIQLSGAEQLPERARQQLVRPYLNQCLGLSQIQTLVQQVSDWYLNRGYVTSRAFLTEQDLAQGVLRLYVLEGRLQEILLEQQPSLMLAMAFPGMEGKILNLRDIEQGMEQINRLHRQPVQIDILPGDRPGYSRVNLHAAPAFPLQLGLSVDNSGQKSTGVEQINGSLIGNNLVGVADQWFISGGRSSAFASDRDAQNVQASVSLPYGYWIADYSYAWSSYLSTFQQQQYAWRYDGASESHRLNVARVLYRNDQLKTGLTLGLTHRNHRNYLNDIRLQSSSRTLTQWSLGLNHSQKLWGGYGTFNPGFSRGVPWLGAESDQHKSADAPRAEFNKWSLSASYFLPLGHEWTWLSSAYGQWSSDRLYGSERLTLGGESSVRGFKEQYLSGDSGGFWRNEISRSLLTLPLLGDLSVLAALDGGYLHSGPDDSEAKGSLVGGALGISGRNRRVSHQFTLGWPLAYPGWLQPDSVAVYYHLTLAL